MFIHVALFVCTQANIWEPNNKWLMATFGKEYVYFKEIYLSVSTVQFWTSFNFCVLVYVAQFQSMGKLVYEGLCL